MLWTVTHKGYICHCCRAHKCHTNLKQTFHVQLERRSTLTGSNDVDAAGIPALSLSEQKQDRVVGQCAEVLSVFYLGPVRLEHESHRLPGDHSELLLPYVTTQTLHTIH